jgi:AraC-like DNA-binding protein
MTRTLALGLVLVGACSANEPVYFPPAAPPKELWVMHARPNYAERYAQVLPADVRFDAPYNAVVMHASTLRTPMRGNHPLLAAALEQRADTLLRGLHATLGITQQVRAVLATRLAAGTPGMFEVAHLLGMSSTTLWRRLSDEGTRFTTVLDELRHEAALSYLRRPEPSINEIATRLGFRDAPAFIKAFKRWSGTTPVRYRDGRCATARVGT